jgi:hypothetical protein
MAADRSVLFGAENVVSVILGGLFAFDINTLKPDGKSPEAVQLTTAVPDAVSETVVIERVDPSGVEEAVAVKVIVGVKDAVGVKVGVTGVVVFVGVLVGVGDFVGFGV